MNTPLAHLSVQELRRAAALRERIERLEKELTQILGGRAAAPAKRRKMSAAGRARIAAAARKRWAKFRKGGASATPKRRRKMGAAAKARLSAMARARWKAAKAAGRTRL